VPEVVQTSGMDCGPASLKALLGGLGIAVGYGALREAAQTDVDGTSIDTLEELAVALGADASQALVPPEQLLLGVAHNLPCITVVRLPSGVLHFLVIWRVVGPWVQVMDPAVGRRWMRRRRLLSQLYHHEMQIPRGAWREHVDSSEFVRPLLAEMRALGMPAASSQRLLRQAQSQSELGPARLEAAVRFVAAMRGAPLTRAQRCELVEHASATEGLVPDSFFSALPADPHAITLRGVIVLRVRGVTPRPPPPSLRALVERPDVVSLWPLGQLVLADGLLRPAFVALLSLLSAGLSIGVALVFRGLVDLTGDFATTRHRLGGLAAIAGLITVHALLDRELGRSLLGMGRQLEVRLRVALYEKLPRMDEVYFRTRLTADLADRAHALHRIGELPVLAGTLLRLGLEMGLVVLAMALLDPYVAPLAALGAVVLLLVPLLASPALIERDRAVREHVGALFCWFSDALRGSWVVQAHTADGPMRQQHERMTVAWAQTARLLSSASVGTELCSASVGVLVAVSVLALHTARVGWTGAALLMVWWSLALPLLGDRIAAAWRALPEARNLALRLLEPLAGPEAPVTPDRSLEGAGGVRLQLEKVTVVLGGRLVLRDLDLSIEPGQHLAIVGRSGSGKSTLVATLLGLYTPTGSLRADGAPLDPPSLRAVTRWIDPSVQLWNRTALSNLRYASADPCADLEQALQDADLLGTVGQLPEGLQTQLGEGGGRLSGGEGQRLRIGRALLRTGARLVLLDEAFRGLDRHQRGQMLERVRQHAGAATLVYITHDVDHALTFDRVVVMAEGRVLEDGAPTELACKPGSHFATLLAAEDRVLARQRETFGSLKAT
jgi:ABC-type bacteriocin/lantibiotic exporter with double-glycine peptidase domain